MDHLIAPEKYNLTEEIEQFANDHDRLALLSVNPAGVKTGQTYAELMDKANAIANGLITQGIEKGDRILIMMPRSIETYAVYVGCLKAGFVVIPSSEMLRPNDLSYRINHSKAKAVIIHHTLIDQINSMGEAPSLKLKVASAQVKDSSWISIEELIKGQSDKYESPETFRDDVAFISYTSGTTGQPKGVVHTHSWAYAHLRTAAKSWLDIQSDDVVWATAGPGWAKWLWSPFMSTLGCGATGFLYEGKFDPEKYLSLLDEYEVNVLCCTPTEYRLMAKVDNLEIYQLSTLKTAVSAGEPLNREVIETFRTHFNLEVRDGYGQTENTLLVGTLKGMEGRPGSMGKPTPGNHVEIITEDGDAADVGEVGDIAVHKDTPALFKEYYKEPERTKRAYRGNYYLTGDKAKKDKDGYFWFEGRGDDIIISSGYTIGPFEVEDALVKHPKVRECAVIGSPDSIRGQVVKAYVVLRSPADAEDSNLVAELQDHVKALTAPYKYPRKITFVEDLPKTTSGKIRRVELRQQDQSEAV